MRKYNIYPTLIDAYTRYLSVEDLYDKYESVKAEPMSLDAYKQKAFYELIDKINRVPFTSVLADQGTCFNELVDCIISKVKPDFNVIRKRDKKGVEVYECEFNGNIFSFPLSVCHNLAEYYKGAMAQVRLDADIEITDGIVNLYGVMDELMPLSVHDIKTTGSYSAGKFKHNSQHLVYPYILIQNGMNIRDFEYNIVEMVNGQVKGMYTEFYSFVPERDIPILRQRLENLVLFLEENRDIITDKKVFNEHLN